MLEVCKVWVSRWVEQLALTLLGLQHHVAPVVEERSDALVKLQLELADACGEVHELGSGQQILATSPRVCGALDVGTGC